MNEYVRLENAKAYIIDRLSQEELLAQLAEEASELTHAALKLRRALDGSNPTPMTLAEATAAAREEIADVWLLVQLLELDVNHEKIEDTMRRKLLRWESRLKEREGRPC